MEVNEKIDNIFRLEDFKFNKNYSISASAGTGKTFSIVGIVKKLKENGIKEDELLIVTYTEKAAGELKDRIKKDVAGFNVDDSHIGTIHSFCKDTMKEFYLTMGLPAGLSVADESKIQSLYEKFIRDYVYNGKIDVRKLEKKDDLKEIVKKIYLDKNGDLNPNIISFKKPYIQSFLEGVLELKGKNKEEVINYFLSYDDPNDRKFTEEVRKSFLTFSGKSTTYLEKKRILELSDTIDKIGKRRKLTEEEKKQKEEYNTYKNNMDDCKKYFDSIRELWDSLYNNIYENGKVNYNFRKKNIDDIVNTIKEFKDYKFDRIFDFEEASIDLYKKWQKEKRRNKWLSFDDMLREVHESVIDENSKLTEKLRKKYKYALIDEFQDTNQIQWDIFKKVFLDSDDNHIIVVGDRKQSIYSFQGADLNVYDSAVKAIEKKGGYLKILNNNYRSSKSMIESYNKLFEMDSFNSLDYKNPVGVGFKDLDAKFDNKSIKGISIVVKKDFEKASPVTPFEYAGMIVKMITDYCSIDEFGKTRLQLYDKDGKERNVSFKDFMILGRTRSEFIAVEYELKKASIPYIKHKDTKLFGGIECAHWVAVINAILKPDFTGKNRNTFRKALFTRFFGKTLREISSPYYETDSTDEMNLILKWKSLAKEFKYTELINSILEDSKIEQRMTSLTDIQSLNIFKQIGDYALGYLLAGNSLMELKNNLVGLMNGETSDEEGGTTVAKGTDFDCVELMTMHASKGLDRAIVFSVGGEKKLSNKVSTVGIYHKDEMTADGTKITRAYLTADNKKYINETKQEFDRLFYVAYTRSRYLLVLPYYKENTDVSVINSTKQFIENDENKKFYEEIVYERIDYKEIKENVKEIIKRITATIEETEKEKINQLGVLKNISKNMNKHSLFKHSYASMSKIKESNEALEGNLNLNKEGLELEEALSGFDLSAKPVEMNYVDIKPNPSPDKFPKGAIVGTALHEVFENFEFSNIDRNNNLLSIIKERFIDNNIKQNLHFEQYVYDMVYNVLNADLPQIKGSSIDTTNTFKLKQISCENRKAEAEFNFGLEDSNLSNYCNGFIDLLFKRGEYYCILDWKSDTINDNDLLSYNNLNDIKKRVDGHYSIQRVLYSYTLVNWLYSCNIESSLEEVFKKHFGGIYYVFIRGCKKNTPNGIYAQTWESYSDLEKEFNKIMNIVKRGGLKGGNLNGQ